MSRTISRRRLLKLIGTSAVLAALSPALHARARYPFRPVPPEPAAEPESDVWAWMGRAIHPLAFYDQPATSGTRLDSRTRDQSFPILGEVRAPFSAHNDLWYKTPLGYVHSAWVYPVRVYPPQSLITDVGDWGFWGEISQIFTEAYSGPSVGAGKVYRFYGGTTYHIVEAFQDEQGTGWYKIYDEFPPTSPTFQWVLARDVRRIPRAEMSPISPFVSQKRVEVNLDQQRLTCFEGERVAFTTLVATGIGTAEGDPLTDLATHRGETWALLKQASRHMCNRPYKEGQVQAGDIFDLPGVPWNIFFDMSGTAVHGTYWHNDFGIRRSHGCVNVSPDAARFVYRWVHPIGGFEDDFIPGDYRVSTPITVI